MTTESIEFIAYDFILHHDLVYPIDMRDILSHFSPCTLLTFEEAAAQFGMPMSKFRCLTGSADAFTANQGGHYLVLYDDNKSYSRINFSLAHELGHILLGHFDGPTPHRIEREADRFAITLICPLPVVYVKQLRSQMDVYNIFKVSTESSNYRWFAFYAWKHSRGFSYIEKLCINTYSQMLNQS